MCASCGTAGTAGGDCDAPPLLATFGTRVDRPRYMAGEGVTAMIVAADNTKHFCCYVGGRGTGDDGSVLAAREAAIDKS